MAATFNIADLYEALADAIPDNAALVAGDVRYTYAELDRRANQLAHALAKRGVTTGSHVGLHMYNHAAYPVTMLACWKLRAVPININYRYVADELRYMIDDAELVMIVSHDVYAPLVDAANYEGSSLQKFIAVRDGAEGELGPHWEDFESILAPEADTRAFGERSAEDLFIVYTGGTKTSSTRRSRAARPAESRPRASSSSSSRRSRGGTRARCSPAPPSSTALRSSRAGSACSPARSSSSRRGRASTLDASSSSSPRRR